MKSIIDRAALRRRARWAHAASLGGLLVLLSSVAISMWRPELAWLSSALLFAGFVVAMTGIAYANRWVKRPRPEEVLEQALKGLSDQHRLYHYIPPGEHVLLTPNGVVVLETVSLEGQFSYQEGRWKQKMTPGRALRMVVEPRLGDPFKEAQAQAALVERLLQEALPAGVKAPVQALVVFTSPLAQVRADKAPLQVAQPDKLAKKIPHPGGKLPPETYQLVRKHLDALLPGGN